MNNFSSWLPARWLAATLFLLAVAGPARAQVASLNEHFDAAPPATWNVQNLSNPVGITAWFQSDLSGFGPQATSGYVAANFNNTTGSGTISDWLLTPQLTLTNGSTLRFWTRVPADGDDYPDRLQVRLSTAGASTIVCASATSVGDFDTLLLDINPTYSTAYPKAWTQYTVILSGLPAATTGRLAFRYFVENGGPSGFNSDYVGLDEVTYQAAPTTPTVTTAAASNLSTTGATLGGTLQSEGGAALSSYGVVYVAGTGTPTTSNTVVQVGSSSPATFPSSFATNVAGLSPGTTYTVRAYATNSGGTAYGSSVTFTTAAITATTWTGTISSDWYTAANWTNGLPSATVSATISASAPFQPTISGNTATTLNLTLNFGTTLTMSGGTLDVRGNLTNNGTLVPTGGTVVLGTTAQSNGPNILGSGQVRFWNLTVNSGGLVLSTSIGASVRRLLTLNGAVVTNGNVFVLESDATGTALVVNTGSAGFVSGAATVRRYVGGANVGYRHFSPATGNTTVGSLAIQGGFAPEISQGATYNTSATPGRVTPFPTVFGYDQNRSATVSSNYSTFDKGWVAPTALSDALTVGKGYAVNLSGQQTFSLSGPLNNGDQNTQTLARTAGSGGYHLLGNPYPAPLDLSLVADADRSGLTGSAYTYTSSAQYQGTYSTYLLPANGNPGVGSTTLTGTSSLLPQGQGFFVQVAAAGTNGTFTFRNSQRVTSYQNPAYNRAQGETRPLAQLTLQPTGSNALADNLYVYFDQYASDGYDPQLDALKLPNPTGLNVSTTLSNGQNLAIDGRAALGSAQRVVPLAVGVPAPGSYTFTVAQLLNLGTTPTYLRDKQTGAVVDLALQPSYQFAVSSASALITDRFELVFSPQQALATVPAALAQQVGVYPNPAAATTAVTIELPAALARQATQADLTDALGRAVRTQRLPAGLGTHTLPLTGLSPGVYALRLTTVAGVIIRKLAVE